MTSLFLGGFGGILGVLLGIHQLGDDFPLVASRIVMVGILSGLFFASLFTRMSAEHGLVVVRVEVVVFILVKVGFGHDGFSKMAQLYWFSC